MSEVKPMFEVGDTALVRPDLQVDADAWHPRNHLSVGTRTAGFAGKTINIIHKTFHRGMWCYKSKELPSYWLSEDMLIFPAKTEDELIALYVQGKVKPEQYEQIKKSITTGSD